MTSLSYVCFQGNRRLLLLLLSSPWLFLKTIDCEKLTSTLQDKRVSWKALPFFNRKSSSVFVVKSSFPPKSWNPTILSIAIPFLEKLILWVLLLKWWRWHYNLAPFQRHMLSWCLKEAKKSQTEPITQESRFRGEHEKRVLIQVIRTKEATETYKKHIWFSLKWNWIYVINMRFIRETTAIFIVMPHNKHSSKGSKVSCSILCLQNGMSK